MEQKSKRPGSIAFLAVGAVVVLAAVLLFFVARIVRCPECGGPRVVNVMGERITVRQHCFRCGGRGRLTPLNRWITQTEEPTASEDMPR